jgi:CRP-like cAMP-binding protein
VDYDHFVREIQQSEKRENFHLLRECKLFANWPRAKVEKMSQYCSRKTYDDGEYIFRQGDEPDNVYFILEGTVNIIKNVTVIQKNR